HQRRPFELEFGTRAEVVGLEPPGDFELIEVAGVDLVQRGIPRPLDVGRVVRPLAVRGRQESWRLSREIGGDARTHDEQRDDAGEEGRRQNDASECSCHLLSFEKCEAPLKAAPKEVRPCTIYGDGASLQVKTGWSSPSITQVNYAFDKGLTDPEQLLDRYFTLTGWSEALLTAGADAVAVVQCFHRDLQMTRNGITYLFC